MLGFRGHFATKSRTYSTTFTQLRRERADYAAHARDRPLELPVPDELVIVVNHWTYAGRDSIAPMPLPAGWADAPELSLAELAVSP
jgi:hypothetical protein